MLEDFDLSVESEFTNAEKGRNLRSQFYTARKPKEQEKRQSLEISEGVKFQPDRKSALVKSVGEGKGTRELEPQGRKKESFGLFPPACSSRSLSPPHHSANFLFVLRLLLSKIVHVRSEASVTFLAEEGVI